MDLEKDHTVSSAIASKHVAHAGVESIKGLGSLNAYLPFAEEFCLANVQEPFPWPTTKSIVVVRDFSGQVKRNGQAD